MRTDSEMKGVSETLWLADICAPLWRLSQVDFTATPCGMAGDVGTTRWPELAPLFRVPGTSQDSIHDVSITAHRVHYTLFKNVDQIH